MAMLSSLARLEGSRSIWFQIGLSRRVALVAPSVENTRRQGARRTSHSPDEPGKGRVALTEQ
jgi:hypothetical protein